MAALVPSRALILLGAMALAACGQGAADEHAPATPPEEPALAPAAMVGRTEPAEPFDPPKMTLPVDAADPAGCNASRAAAFVGQRADPPVRAGLAAAVAPTPAIRWVRPGDATTEDYSPQRLNVMLDVAGTIVGAHCG